MKQIIFLGVLAIMAESLAVNPASAQIQWTAEQKAVWKTETTIADLVLKGDLQGARQYLDDSWVAWPSNSPVPIPKSNIVKWQDFIKAQGQKLLFFDVVPEVIWVKGDFAYVYYHQREVAEGKDGKKKRYDSRWMDALMKKGDRWVVVGDLGGLDPAAK